MLWTNYYKIMLRIVMDIWTMLEFQNCYMFKAKMLIVLFVLSQVNQFVQLKLSEDKITLIWLFKSSSFVQLNNLPDWVIIKIWKTPKLLWKNFTPIHIFGQYYSIFSYRNYVLKNISSIVSSKWNQSRWATQAKYMSTQINQLS